MPLEAILTFFLVVGVGFCVFYAARVGKVKFTLRSVFVLITTLCVGLAGFATFGPSVFYPLWVFASVATPPANLIVVAMLVVSVVHSRDEKQAGYIGMLVPLACLAISDSIRIGGLLTAGFQALGGSSDATTIVIYLLAYLTSWASGSVCRHWFRN